MRSVTVLIAIYLLVGAVAAIPLNTQDFDPGLVKGSSDKVEGKRRLSKRDVGLLRLVESNVSTDPDETSSHTLYSVQGRLTDAIIMMNRFDCQALRGGFRDIGSHLRPLKVERHPATGADFSQFSEMRKPMKPPHPLQEYREPGATPFIFGGRPSDYDADVESSFRRVRTYEVPPVISSTIASKPASPLYQPSNLASIKTKIALATQTSAAIKLEEPKGYLSDPANRNKIFGAIAVSSGLSLLVAYQARNNMETTDKNNEMVAKLQNDMQAASDKFAADQTLAGRQPGSGASENLFRIQKRSLHTPSREHDKQLMKREPNLGWLFVKGGLATLVGVAYGTGIHRIGEQRDETRRIEERKQAYVNRPASQRLNNYGPYFPYPIVRHDSSWF